MLSNRQDDVTRDAALLERTANGDMGAFGHLVARHQAAVFRYARTLAGNDQEAEDVLQETFINAMRAADNFRGEAGARAWLLVICRRVLIRLRRLRAGEPTRHDTLDELGAAAGWGDPTTPERLLAQMQTRKQLAAAMDTLSPEDREVLVLRDLEELTAAEVSEMLGLTVAAVKSRLHRARLRLAAELRGGKEGGHRELA